MTLSLPSRIVHYAWATTAGITPVANLQAIPDNTTLQATPTTAASTVIRYDYVVGGGAPAVLYNASGSACTLNGGAGDNGSQVRSADGKCWIANLNGIEPNPKIWGCLGDGVADDAACLQAAIAATGPGKLYSGRHLYRTNTGLSSSNPGFEFVCESKRSGSDPNPYGLRAGAANLTLLSLNGSDQAVRNCYIDMTNNGTLANTSGTAIAIGITSNAVVEENYIYGPCNGIDVNGNVPHVYRNRITSQNVDNSGCSGIRIGNLTAGANTVDAHLEYNVVEGGYPKPFDAAVLILDSGGPTLGYNDFLFSLWGVKIVPGAKQVVTWLTATGTYLGDTTVLGSLYIDATASSALVTGLTFNQTWTASATNGPGVTIKNTGGGIVKGIHFNQHRSYNNALSGFDVQAGSEISIDASMVCNNSTARPRSASGIKLAAGVSKVQIRNNRIASDCSGSTIAGAQGFGIDLIDGSNSEIMITGNNLYDPRAYAPIGGTPRGMSIVANNLGVDDTTGSTLASAATININAVYPRWHITGTKGINTIDGFWGGRVVNFITDNGSVAFSTGGNICNAYKSAGAGASVYADYDLSAACWRLH